MNVVILAGGLNSRFKDLQRIPKILLPTVTESSILLHDIEFFKGSDIYLIVLEKYYDMVKNYIDINKLSDKITLLKTKKTESTFDTIKGVQQFLPEENVLFVWSDLILHDTLELNQDDDAVIVTNPEGRYRYGIKGNNNDKLEAVSDSSGNVCGMYYLKNLELLKRTVGKYPDFVDFIADKYKFKTLNYIVEEYQTIDVFYTKYGKNKLKEAGTRFFNTLVIDKEKKTCRKQCINNQFYHLIDKENMWYSKVKGQPFIPKIFDSASGHHSITMEYLNGYIPLYKFVQQNKTNYDLLDIIFKKLFDNMSLMHNIEVSYPSKTQVEEDFEKEIITKTIDRLESIKYCILDYNKGDVSDLLTKAKTKLLNYFLSEGPAQYNFIHGDIHASNCLISPTTLDIKFLDPRGYFGKTVMQGPKLYDYAKVLYSLYGYDNFNTGEFVFYNKNTYDIPEQFYVPAYLNTSIYKLMVGVIYVAFAQYIANDIFKINIAYQYGMSLIKENL